MSKKIEPHIILTIDIHSLVNIPFIVRTISGEILFINHISKVNGAYKIRKDVIENIRYIIEQYNIDTIIMEQNRLFIDKIDRHPDPLVLRNITLGFGIQISIEDNFYASINNILAIPTWEWSKLILGTNVHYIFDQIKTHILEQNIYSAYYETIEQNNYYKVVCLSESVLFEELINKKYLLNKKSKGD